MKNKRKCKSIYDWYKLTQSIRASHKWGWNLQHNNHSVLGFFSNNSSSEKWPRKHNNYNLIYWFIAFMNLEIRKFNQLMNK